ncbi:MAG TPA: carbohydrate binding family 9 domain-containing protein, partial [Vicinamibacteria bacterium]|nr:carbohydrate binding family 9 domain-containing protein [Vicinamibacteria bacterium]
MPVAPRAIPRLVVSVLCLVPGALAQDEGGKNSTTPPVVIHGPPPPEPPAVLSRDDRGRVTIRATRIAEPIVLDGKLDELLYRQVPPVNGFVQQEPNEGAPATEDTDAWIFFDDENVYISARCWDSHPERMIANEMRRDHRNIFQNENFTIVLDTFYDRRNGFFFQTNPLGALRDQEVGDEGNQNNNDWNTVWHVRASKFDRGWVLEVAIPFKSLRYKEGRDQIWGINLKRSVRWKNEESFISPVAASHRFRGVYRFSEA